MIITKVICGWVNQRFNTETRRFIDQKFVVGDGVTWESSDGYGYQLFPKGADIRAEVNPRQLCLDFEPGTENEPCLDTEMVQPLTTAQIEAVSNSIQLEQVHVSERNSALNTLAYKMDSKQQPVPLLAKASSFEVGESVLVTPSDDQDALFRNEFMGIVLEVKGDRVLVRDADDDAWDCDAVQCHHVK